MSRGHGAVQRRVLDQLRRRAERHPPLSDLEPDAWYPSWLPVIDIAGVAASRATVESVRRAVLRLEAEGLVETAVVRRMARGGIFGQPLLQARLKPDDETAEIWQRWHDRKLHGRQLLVDQLARSGS